MGLFQLTDLIGIDTHGIEYKYDAENFQLEIELPMVKIYIEKRNFYCDRGRFGFWAESKDREKMSIDYADGFPRYFFSLQRAFDEMNDWIQFRTKEIYQT